jgi:hypothetical protein
MLGSDSYQNSCEGRVEVPMTDHLRDYASAPEEYNVVQTFPMYKDCHFYGSFIP